MRDDYPLSPTFTGKRFDVTALRDEDVDILDIAHHLSQINRYTGATQEPYNVAQHSVMAVYALPLLGYHPTSTMVRATLLHDAAEAYTGDFNHNIKYHSHAGMAILELERRVESVIERVFGVKLDSSYVKECDEYIFDYEWRNLIEERSMRCWTPTHAEARFLECYNSNRATEAPRPDLAAHEGPEGQGRSVAALGQEPLPED